MKFEDLEQARQTYVDRFKKVLLMSLSVAALPSLLFIAPMLRGGLIVFSLIFFALFAGGIAYIFTVVYTKKDAAGNRRSRPEKGERPAQCFASGGSSEGTCRG